MENNADIKRLESDGPVSFARQRPDENTGSQRPPDDFVPPRGRRKIGRPDRRFTRNPSITFVPTPVENA